jgi:hypothetical protein
LWPARNEQNEQRNEHNVRFSRQTGADKSKAKGMQAEVGQEAGQVIRNTPIGM